MHVFMPDFCPTMFSFGLSLCTVVPVTGLACCTVMTVPGLACCTVVICFLQNLPVTFTNDPEVRGAELLNSAWDGASLCWDPVRHWVG